MSNIPELNDLELFLKKYSSSVHVEVLDNIKFQNQSWPLYGLSIGNQSPAANTFGIFSGVHGLERIGTHVCLSFLNSLMERKNWDSSIDIFLKKNKIISIPIINPYGLAFNQRHNMNHVDLMRNSPIEATGKLICGVSGQRYSPNLPWFRGEINHIEPELLAINKFTQKHFYDAKKAITIDLHSGFGLKDRLWYPWAKSQDEFPQIDAINKLTSQFESTYPYHIYKIEPQNKSYLTHGDIWDWIYEQQQIQNPNSYYIPFTLEMGSWMWVKKNPIQLFSKQGPFNPIKKHRYARTMRRHLHLLEFLMRSIDN